MDRYGYEDREDYLRTLDSLDDWELQDGDQDIRGRPLVTTTGESVGVIDDLLVDRDHKRVAGVRVEDGRVFPVEPLSIEDDRVVLATATETGTVTDRRRYVDGVCTVRARNAT